MKKEIAVVWTCKYCGRDTSHVETDYLAGTDHLECTLKETLTNDLQLQNRQPVFNLNIPASLIEEISNDQELGEKIRLMYHEAKNLRRRVL